MGSVLAGALSTSFAGMALPAAALESAPSALEVPAGVAHLASGGLEALPPELREPVRLAFADALTDVFGRDVLSRVIYGTKISVAIAVVATAFVPAIELRRGPTPGPAAEG